MDADSFYASFLISILYPNCNDDKVNEGYCHWENVTDDSGQPISCTEEIKREWFRNPALQPLIEELLSELERHSRNQLGIQEKN